MTTFDIETGLLEQTQDALLEKNEAVGYAVELEGQKRTLAGIVVGLIQALRDERGATDEALLFVAAVKDTPALPRYLRDDAKRLLRRVGGAVRKIRADAQTDADFAQLERWIGEQTYPLTDDEETGSDGQL